MGNVVLHGTGPPRSTLGKGLLGSSCACTALVRPASQLLHLRSLGEHHTDVLFCAGAEDSHLKLEPRGDGKSGRPEEHREAGWGLWLGRSEGEAPGIPRAGF